MGGHITNNIQVLHEDQSVEEEVLSLCELPLDLDANTDPRNDPLQTPKHTPEAALEFFQFSNNESGFFMCPADDIISGGKLVPFGGKTRRKDHVLRKRSESLSELRSSSSTKNGAPLLRISRSLDSQEQKEKVSSTKSSGQSDVSTKNVVKPRWYFFMFGSVKFPPEMELQDIKSRQLRRNPSVIFSDEGQKVADNNRSSDKTSSWSLLKVLSCREYTSVSITSSFYKPDN